ncbi:hypothetical protein QC764_0038870 [Podospora pseudoanserina]|nr:hypothetical protein QC764_0038870 [Podospora pseudoanserina]
MPLSWQHDLCSFGTLISAESTSQLLALHSNFTTNTSVACHLARRKVASSTVNARLFNILKLFACLYTV